MAIKISKIQKRLNAGNAVNSARAIARPFQKLPNEVIYKEWTTRPGTVMFMARDVATKIDHNGCPIISINDIGVTVPEFINPGPVLELHFSPYSKMNKENSDKLLAFIKEHIAVDRPELHIHCKYGQIRSYTMAKAISVDLAYANPKKVNAQHYVHDLLDILSREDELDAMLYHTVRKQARTAMRELSEERALQKNTQ